MHEGHHGILDEEKLNPKGKSHHKNSKGETDHGHHHHHDDKREQNGKIFATVAVMVFIFYVVYIGFIQ